MLNYGTLSFAYLACGRLHILLALSLSLSFFFSCQPFSLYFISTAAVVAVAVVVALLVIVISEFFYVSLKSCMNACCWTYYVCTYILANLLARLVVGGWMVERHIKFTWLLEENDDHDADDDQKGGKKVKLNVRAPTI